MNGGRMNCTDYHRFQ